MGINTLFLNIANAIRSKSGDSDTLTPAQMPQAILDLPSGGGETGLIEEWDFTESLTGKILGTTLTTTGTVTITNDGAVFSAGSSAAYTSASILNKSYVLELGTVDFKGSQSHHTGILMFFHDACGLLIRNTGKISFYLNSWYNSDISLSSISDINDYFSNSIIKVTVDSSYAYLYVNNDLILTASISNIDTPNDYKYLSIGDSRAESSGGQFYDFTVKSFKVYAEGL